MLRRVLCCCWLIARRKRLRCRAADKAALLRLLLRLRRVARLVLAHEGLAVVVVVVKLSSAAPCGVALALLRLRIVIRVLLAELFLRRGDQAEIMLGVLIVIFGRHRIAGALRVARELDVFLRDMRGGAADLHVGSVRLVDPRQRILALAVVIVVVASPHALLTVSHRFACSLTFRFMRRTPPLLDQPQLHTVHLQVHAAIIAARQCPRRFATTNVDRLRSLSR